MGQLFGTDGIRGEANQYPITAEMALRIGRTAAFMFKPQHERGNIVVGQDTRLSGDMIAYSLMAGICSMDVDVQYVGTIPTPAVAHLTVSSHATAGIMISASHNPYHDNGIKLFNQDGFKLPVQMEDKFEHLLLYQYDVISSSLTDKTGRVFIPPRASDQYESFLRKAVPDTFSLDGMKIVMDCSNGATYKLAPDFFSKLGASVTPMFVHPDGININDNCGSQHPEHVRQKVLETKSDIGLAFDGDGDRLIAVDENGDTVTGDSILAICAKMLKQQNQLKNNLAVTTVMSNVGLGIALKEMGIDHIMTDVGDRHVMEKMIAEGSILGGEDSGHTIFLNHHTTGDGILTALKLMEAMRHESKPLSQLSRLVSFYPQVLINVEVKKKADLESDPDIQRVIHLVREKLGKAGRVLVRYSGTRPLCRVMVEGASKTNTRAYALEIADVITKKLGKSA